MGKFYRVTVDWNAVGCWYLGAPVDELNERIEPEKFRVGKIVSGLTAMTIPVKNPGTMLNFNFASFDMIVCRSEIVSEMESSFGVSVQRIPVTVEGCIKGFEILNPLASVACVDLNRSNYARWNDTDGRPERVGRFRVINELYIDDRASGQHLFRVDEWKIALIVSEPVKAFLERKAGYGIDFIPVS